MYHCSVCAVTGTGTEFRHCNVGHHDGKDTAFCRVQFRYQDGGCRAYFCTIHQQWVYEFSIETRHIFATDELEGCRNA